MYGVKNNLPLKLDVWHRQDHQMPVPTVIYIHGGGWVFGAKASADTLLMPYLQKGWNAVNVEYRMAGQSLAPAAVEGSRCALRWVFQNAQKYHFDTDNQLVTIPGGVHGSFNDAETENAYKQIGQFLSIHVKGL